MNKQIELNHIYLTLNKFYYKNFFHKIKQLNPIF